jgi:hypothetical protein
MRVAAARLQSPQEIADTNAISTSQMKFRFPPNMEKRTQNATFDFGHMDFDFAPNRWEYDFYNSKLHFRLPFTVWGVKYLKGPNLGKPIPQ